MLTTVPAQLDVGPSVINRGQGPKECGDNVRRSNFAAAFLPGKANTFECYSYYLG
jgi:hypothetical protein